ncbi:MAG TPA: ArsR family transcriptional regulator [Anaerolineales bacterium]|nr:ArsR family transcriptional regulator [Anaerolineales bacterium]
MTTSRKRVLDYLARQHTATAAQIGRGLNMSAANVRHHLSVMLNDGRIALVGQSHTARRGRPVKLYGLSEKSMGDNLAMLSETLLNELLAPSPPAAHDALMNAVAQRMAPQFQEDDSSRTAPIAARITVLVRKLNELHYQAHWEAGAQGPRILLAHCPYAAIIARHPELCHMDEVLIASAAKSPARQVSKIEGQKTAYCIFVLDPTS